MRLDIVHPGADKLRYEIREIVEVAKRVEKAGIPIIWENIGDPVAKGETPPSWIKKIVANAAKEDVVFAYSPTKGLDETRANTWTRSCLSDALVRRGGPFGQVAPLVSS